MKHYHIQFLVSILCVLSVFSCQYTYADNSSNEVICIEKARNHMKEHSIIHEILADEMVATVEWDEFGSCDVVFHYFAFSEPVVRVRFNKNLDVVNCNCSYITEERYQRGLDYFCEMRSAAAATIEWEKEYGPSQLWGMNENAAFFEEYHYYPRETQQMFEATTEYSGYGFPSTCDITPVDAMQIANQILKDHFYCTDAIIGSLNSGIAYVPETRDLPSAYFINYYSNCNGNLDLEYVIILLSSNGLCYQADYRKYQYGNAEEEQRKENPLDGLYWSEYFDMVRLEDGSFIRVEKNKN